jgi:hypothetical protein
VYRPGSTGSSQVFVQEYNLIHLYNKRLINVVADTRCSLTGCRPFVEYRVVIKRKCSSQSLQRGCTSTLSHVSSSSYSSLMQGFSNCGTPATVQWYTCIVRKNK